MTSNGHAKIQHYVPQFLLKNFSKGKKSSVFVFDKQNNRQYKANTRKIVSENRFYDFKLNIKEYEISGSIEETLSKIESDANNVLKKILDADNISVIDDIDKEKLSAFLAVQVARTKSTRINYELVSQNLKTVLQERNCPIELLKDLDLSEGEKDFFFDKFVIEETKNLMGVFYDKIWIWCKNETKILFCLGDDPVVCYNEFSTETDSMLNPHGFGIVGTITYLPITPTRALCLFCPVEGEKIINSFNEIQNLLSYKSLPINHIYFSHELDKYRMLYDTLTNNIPLSFQEDRIKHINSLEILNAEKYIISSDGDFRFTEIILKNSIHKNHGKRIKME